MEIKEENFLDQGEYNFDKIDNLKNLLKEGLPKVESAADQEAVLVVGNTGSGKSCSINYWLHYKMEKIKTGPYRNRITTVGLSAAQIGHTGTSETLFAQSYKYGPTLKRPTVVNEYDFELEKWRNSINPGAVLFIFSPRQNEWHAFVKKQDEHNALERQVMTHHPAFMSILRKILTTKQAEDINNIAALVSCLKNNPLFSHEIQQYAESPPKNNFVFLDCPGFEGNRGVEENICEALSFELGVRKAKCIKAVVIVVDYNELVTTRGLAFTALVKRLSLLFDQTNNTDTDNLSYLINYLSNSIYFTITKMDSHPDMKGLNQEQRMDQLKNKIKEALTKLDIEKKPIEATLVKLEKEKKSIEADLAKLEKEKKPTEATLAELKEKRKCYKKIENSLRNKSNAFSNLIKQKCILSCMESHLADKKIVPMEMLDQGKSRDKFLKLLESSIPINRENYEKVFNFDQFNKQRLDFQNFVSCVCGEGIINIRAYITASEKVQKEQAKIEELKNEIISLNERIKNVQLSYENPSNDRYNEYQQKIAHHYNQIQEAQHEIARLNSDDYPQSAYWSSYCDQAKAKNINEAVQIGAVGAGCFLMLAGIAFPPLIAAGAGIALSAEAVYVSFKFYSYEREFNYEGMAFDEVTLRCSDGGFKLSVSDKRRGLYKVTYSPAKPLSTGGKASVSIWIKKKNLIENRQYISVLNEWINGLQQEINRINEEIEESRKRMQQPLHQQINSCNEAIMRYQKLLASQLISFDQVKSVYDRTIDFYKLIAEVLNCIHLPDNSGHLFKEFISLTQYDPSKNYHLNFDQKIKQKSTPLLLAVEQGKLDIVRQLTAEDADFYYVDENYATIIDVAFLKVKWDVLAYLIENRPAYSANLLKSVLDMCCEQYIGNYQNQSHDVECLDHYASLLTHVNITEHRIKQSPLKHYAHLDQLEGTVGKSKTIKSNDGKFYTVHDQSLTGWRTVDFLPLRIRYLLSILVQMRKNKIHGCDLPDEPEILYRKLERELITELETLRWCRDLNIIHEAPKAQQEKLKKAHIANVAKSIASLEKGQELSYSTGFVGHALYVNFVRQGNNIIIRIDNLGGGCDKHLMVKKSLKNNAGEKIHREPYVVAWHLIESFKKPTPKVYQYLKNICEAKFLSEQAALTLIYADKHIVSKQPWNIAKKQQTVGNCVVRNHNQGMHIRLSTDGHNKHIYSWFKEHEKKMSVGDMPESNIGSEENSSYRI